MCQLYNRLRERLQKRMYQLRRTRRQLQQLRGLQLLRRLRRSARGYLRPWLQRLFRLRVVR
jgi:hypothetical protein